MKQKNNCPIYVYKAKLVKVVDGDTVDLEIDLGFNIKFTTRVRFAKINTPELRSKDPNERQKAKQAKNFVIKWFQKYNNNCIIESIKKPKKGKYGRYIVYIYDPKQKECLNTLLLQNNLAKPYKQ